MKYLVCSLLVSLSFFNFSYSQYSKEGIEKMLVEVGTSMDKMETLYVGNVKSFYTDGTSKYSYSKYKKVYSKGTNKISLSSEGVVVKSFVDGKLVSVRVFNYKYIRTVYFSDTYFEVHMAN